MLSLLVTFLVGFKTMTPAYNKLSDVSFTVHDVWANTSVPLGTRYIYHGQDSALSDKEVERVIKKTEIAIQHYSKEKGYPMEQCRTIDTLEIYYVRQDELNKRGRFPIFMNENLSPNDVVWGVYDPVSQSPHYAVLMISNPGGTKTEETQAHELYHYWYDRFCWERHHPGDPESAALEFETFYELNYM